MPAKLRRVKRGTQVFMVIRFSGEISETEARQFNEQLDKLVEMFNESTRSCNVDPRGKREGNAGLAMVLANNARKVAAEF
jgi:hypothetical protein